MKDEDRIQPYHWGELWRAYEELNEKCRFEYDRTSGGRIRNCTRYHVRVVRNYYALMVTASRVGRVA